MKKIVFLFVAVLIFSGMSLFAQQDGDSQRTYTKDGVKVTGTNMWASQFFDNRYYFETHNGNTTAKLIIENTTSETKMVIIVLSTLTGRSGDRNTYSTKESPEYTLKPKERRNAVIPIRGRTHISEIIVY